MNKSCLASAKQVCYSGPYAGGVRGGSSEPPFRPPKYLIYTSKLYILGILPFESCPLVSLLLRINAVQTGLVAAIVCEFVHGGSAHKLFYAAAMKGPA